MEVLHPDSKTRPLRRRHANSSSLWSRSPCDRTRQHHLPGEPRTKARSFSLLGFVWESSSPKPSRRPKPKRCQSKLLRPRGAARHWEHHLEWSIIRKRDHWLSLTWFPEPSLVGSSPRASSGTLTSWPTRLRQPSLRCPSNSSKLPAMWFQPRRLFDTNVTRRSLQPSRKRSLRILTTS